MGAAGPGRPLCGPDEHARRLEGLDFGFEIESDGLESELRIGAQDRTTAQHRNVGATLVPRRPLHTIDEEGPGGVRRRRDLDDVLRKDGRSCRPASFRPDDAWVRDLRALRHGSLSDRGRTSDVSGSGQDIQHRSPFITRMNGP